jgi:Family of unknown function (DUF6262)
MPDRIQALRQAAQARHEQTLRRAEAALNSLARRGEPVTVRGVADAARVSRSWTYQQPRLLGAARTAAITSRTGNVLDMSMTPKP